MRAEFTAEMGRRYAAWRAMYPDVEIPKFSAQQSASSANPDGALHFDLMVQIDIPQKRQSAEKLAQAKEIVARAIELIAAGHRCVVREAPQSRGWVEFQSGIVRASGYVRFYVFDRPGDCEWPRSGGEDQPQIRYLHPAA